MILGLCLIMLAVLLAPFLLKPVEENLEVFLFVMGLAAAATSRSLDVDLVREALVEPLAISLTVLASGVVFKGGRRWLDAGIAWLMARLSARLFVFLLIAALGLLSSIITAIIASLVLVEIITLLKLDEETETRIVIVACFAIGLGAVLTPVGEPLSTIAVAKLKQDFWYPMRLLGPLVIPGVIAVSAVSLFFHGRESADTLRARGEVETYGGVVLRAVKVYVFVMALLFLGQGFKPVIDRYLVPLHGNVLYWINMVSAILDNATLTAAEISPRMTEAQVRSVLMGLLISGGMLIPGNIPNIISAGKLGISSRAWARLGVPLGLAIMLVYFAILNLMARAGA